MTKTHKLPRLPRLKERQAQGNSVLTDPLALTLHTLHTPAAAHSLAAKALLPQGVQLLSKAARQPLPLSSAAASRVPASASKLCRWLPPSQPAHVLLAPTPAAQPKAQPSSCPCSRRWRLAAGCTRRPPARLPRPCRHRPPAAAASARPASGCMLRSPAKTP